MKTSLVDAEGYPKSGLDIMAIRSLRQKIIHLQNDLKGVMNQVKVALENLHELKSLEAKENALGVTFETNSQSSSSSSSSVDYSSASSQRNTSAITSPTPSTSSFTPSNPFARVDTISPNSPASICGLLTGDLILQFGTLKDTNFTGMTSIASLVRDSENVWTFFFSPRIFLYISYESNVECPFLIFCIYFNVNFIIFSPILHNEKKAPIDLIIDRRGEIIPITLTPRRWSGQGLLG